MCLFISIPYPNQVYDKQRKQHFSVVICVRCIMSCYKIFLFQGGTNHGGDLWQTLVCFLYFKKTSPVLIFWLMPGTIEIKFSFVPSQLKHAC